MPRLPIPHRHALPREVRETLPLEPGERPLAWTALTDGRTVVATDRALLAPAGDGWERLPWWQVWSATWDNDAERLVVEAATTDGRRILRLALAEESHVPETVRERVQSSIVVSQHVPLRGRVGVRIMARRVPDREDLLWQAVLDPGLDPDDPTVRAGADRALTELRRQTTA